MAIYPLAAPLLPARPALRRSRLPPAAGPVRPRIEAETIARLADLSDCRVVAVAGEDAGLVLATLLARHQHATGLASEGTQLDAADAFPGVAPRIRLRQGEATALPPRGADAYVLKRLLAVRDDAAAIELLTQCRARVSRHARLLIAETVAVRDWLGDLAGWFAARGARIRTLDEIAELLRRAGFAAQRYEPHPAIDLVEAMPA